MVKKWVPLESNPDVLNEYAGALGLVPGTEFADVYGLDDELLAMVPQPVLAVLLCYPITDDTEAAMKAEDAASACSPGTPTNGPGSVYFMEQTIGNACGTIGLLHIVGNVGVERKPDSFLDQFFLATASMDPAARGKYLEDPPEGAPNIEEAHQAASLQGQSAAPTEDVLLHFVAFVNHNGRLVQLDGRRPRPVDCGPTSDASLLKDTAAVVVKFAEITKSITFNLMALVQSS
ncbi:hypothetical protein FOA52_012118 [Chlamydomonas sp. UWO 241]|nr:hypothetical protein FOA52_012118 [Chlamydomonas sp. UWO 241]